MAGGVASFTAVMRGVEVLAAGADGVTVWAPREATTATRRPRDTPTARRADEPGM